MEVIEAPPIEGRARRHWGRRKRDRVAPPSAPAFDLAPPQWVAALLAKRASASEETGTGSHVQPGTGPCAAQPSLRVQQSDRFTLCTARVARAGDLDDDAFERHCAQAYAALSDAVGASAAPHPLRFWNHIPAIRNTKQPGLDRYMVFNAGRYAACSAWFGSPDAFDRLLPTASAVGHDGADLVVHVLSGSAPGAAVENPRQVPSYRYSRRFGPRPPCFARATALRDPAGGRTTILVGGTASIRGEDTAHPRDLRAQALETFENLQALVRAAGAAGLESFESLRVYYVHPADRHAITQMVAAAFPHRGDVEYVQADLCRPDLLVEIEGVACGVPKGE
jgi:enamine deaminase RidA (YjgF/YER057c/UK114 family)